MNIQIVVNADDFGMSTGVNNAILTSFENKWISSTTIMCNMPGFEEACEIAHSRKIIDRIGIHLNITEGTPLTENIKKLPKFCNEKGEMYKSFKGHFFNEIESKAIYIELEAQINRLIKNKIFPSHADSHRHSHHYIGIQNLVIKLAKAYKIPAIRLRHNWGNLSIQRKIYSKIYNMRLGLAGLAKTKYFCEIRDVTEELLNIGKPIEIMVHPYPGENESIINYKNGDDFSALIKKYLDNINFIPYNKI
jgi:predicted glycoside hydrolase/deacetylase ChbG (UPF0249 family)